MDPFDRTLKLPSPNLTPPGPKTGYSHPKCWLRGTQNCGEKLTREHYVSKNILLQLGEKIEVTGIQAINDGAPTVLPPNSLQAKVLCKRHNEKLNDLDSDVGKFFGYLRACFSDLNRKAFAPRQHYYLVSGDALELWMLKLAMGIYNSIATDGKVPLKNLRTVDEKLFLDALYSGKWIGRSGLYMNAQLGGKIALNSLVGVAPLSDVIGQKYCGVQCDFHGLKFDLLFSDENTNKGEWGALVHRPRGFSFWRKRRAHHFYLTWKDIRPGGWVVFDR
ncbi:hypothetical protein ABWH98_07585 [Labrenzia sp. ac12]